LAACGAVGEEEEVLLADAFRFPPGEAADRGVPSGVPGPSPGRFSYPKDLGQVYLEIGVPCVGMDHPDRYGLVLLANLLGGGMSSRLFQRVREQEGLAYSIYSYADFSADLGCLCTSLSASPDKGARALAVIAHEYQRLRRGDVDDAEIEVNRNQVLAAMVLGLEGSYHQMTRLARSEIYHGRFVPLEEMVAAVHAVTRDDVIRLAETYLVPEHQTVVGHGPGEDLSFEA
jgi:predicted Zn-dependent peptidase